MSDRRCCSRETRKDGSRVGIISSADVDYDVGICKKVLVDFEIVSVADDRYD